MQTLLTRHEFDRETISQVYSEIGDLLRENHRQTGMDIPLKIRWELYNSVEESGHLAIFTSRHNKRLVGYAIFFLANHPHYGDTLWARQDIMFVEPSHRGMESIRFMKWSDEQLAEMGVDYIYRSANGKCNYSRLLLRQGYKPLEVALVKKVSHGG